MPPKPTEQTAPDPADTTPPPPAGDANMIDGAATGDLALGDAPTDPAPPPAPTTGPTNLKPVVIFGTKDVTVHLLPDGRAIFAGKKTKLFSLDRDPAALLDDPNVKLALAMVAGPDMRDAIHNAGPIDGAPADVAAAYTKATGG